MELERKIEALLFYKGEPETLWDIGVALRAEPDDVKTAIANLREQLSGRGITLVEQGDTVMLGTAPELSTLFEQLRKDELSKELSKAALETLSIVLYRDGATRSEINFIRGVNSGYILRALEIRGLVERGTHASDSRVSIYRPTLEALAFLGVGSASELPDYARVRETLEKKLTNQPASEDHEGI